MATVGQQLLAPESGWSRYDSTNSNFVYTSKWILQSSAEGAYNSNFHYCGTTVSNGVALETVKFNVITDKIRIIAYMFSSRSSNISIIIDGVPYTFSELGNALNQTIVYENLNLKFEEHSIIIRTNDTASVNFDAIDINSTGSLLAYNASPNKFPVINNPKLTYDRANLTLSISSITDIDNDMIKYKVSIKLPNGEIVVKQDWSAFQPTPFVVPDIVFAKDEILMGNNQIVVDVSDGKNGNIQWIGNFMKSTIYKYLIQQGTDIYTVNPVLYKVGTETIRETFLKYGSDDLISMTKTLNESAISMNKVGALGVGNEFESNLSSDILSIINMEVK